MVQVTDRVRTIRRIGITFKINGKRGGYKESTRMLFGSSFVFYILLRSFFKANEVWSLNDGRDVGGSASINPLPSKQAELLSCMVVCVAH